ncbi:hypothetical protein AgCh_000822 [Apium graveolens]
MRVVVDDMCLQVQMLGGGMIPNFSTTCTALVDAGIPLKHLVSNVADFIAETIQGAGGAVGLALGYLKLVYDIVRKADGLCIADEVQTGFGRTGSHYWGFQTQGVIPDIVTMAEVTSLTLQVLCKYKPVFCNLNSTLWSEF